MDRYVILIRMGVKVMNRNGAKRDVQPWNHERIERLNFLFQVKTFIAFTPNFAFVDGSFDLIFV